VNRFVDLIAALLRSIDPDYIVERVTGKTEVSAKKSKQRLDNCLGITLRS
jgi:hypothetical protein